jgi:hypothetical protein
MLLLQNILYCLLFILMVKCLVRNDGMNCVYFYPKEYIEEADKRCGHEKRKAGYDSILHHFVRGADRDHFCLE